MVLKYVIKPVPSLFLLFPISVVAAVGVVVGSDAAADAVQVVQLRAVAMAAVAYTSTTSAVAASLQTCTINSK